MQGTAEGSKRKKVLILTYYWPPAGGPGVQRVLKFVKYLPEFGWEPIVLTVQNGEYPAIDESLRAEVPADIRVFQTRTVEFFSLFKRLSGRKKEAAIETFFLNRKKMPLKDRIFSWIRQNIFIPDARLGWIPFAVREGARILQEEKPSVIFSSSPPHSLHLAALRLSRKYQTPWVADFRDPWTEAFYEKGQARSALSRRINAYFEQKVLRRAHAVLSVNRSILELLYHQTPPGNAHAVPNGYDAEDFNLKKKQSAQFRIVYAGHLDSSQNPERFFAALAALNDAHPGLVRADFYGKTDALIRESIRRYGLEDILHCQPYVPHAQILQVITDADLLLLLIPRPFSKGIVTGKIFEYLATRNFILGIGDPAGDAAQILQECQAGEMLSYEADPGDILEAQFQRWQQGLGTPSNAEAVSKYERRETAKSLAQILDRYAMG